MHQQYPCVGWVRLNRASSVPDLLVVVHARLHRRQQCQSLHSGDADAADLGAPVSAGNPFADFA